MADFIKSVLTTINTSLPNSIWNSDEIDNVSNDLATRPLDKLGRIFQNALLNPVNRTLRPKITKYYTLIKQDQTKESLINSVNFPTDPVDNQIYRGFTNLYMSDETYMNPTTDILYFMGCRSRFDPKINLPSLYNETLCIISNNTTLTEFENGIPLYQNKNNADFIQAVSNYVDGGETFATEIPFINYTVTGASGIYEGYKNVNITFDKDRKTRIVEITA
jgi:hypothetical protein